MVLPINRKSSPIARIEPMAIPEIATSLFLRLLRRDKKDIYYFMKVKLCKGDS
jgi:hypothetical protein